MAGFRGIKEKKLEIKVLDKKHKNYEKMQSEKESNWRREHPTNCRYKNTRNGCMREDININFVVIGHTGTGKVRSYYNPTESEEKK